MFKPRQPERGVSGFILEHKSSDHLSQRWTMLKSVPRASSNHPNVVIAGMPIDNKIFVAGIFVLAYT